MSLFWGLCLLGFPKFDQYSSLLEHFQIDVLCMRMWAWYALFYRKFIRKYVCVKYALFKRQFIRMRWGARGGGIAYSSGWIYYIILRALFPDIIPREQSVYSRSCFSTSCHDHCFQGIHPSWPLQCIDIDRAKINVSLALMFTFGFPFIFPIYQTPIKSWAVKNWNFGRNQRLLTKQKVFSLA